MTESMVERVARAMEDAELGYSMNLISLIDGVYTYRLQYDDGETLEFGSTDEVYEHVAQKRRITQARAAIEAMRVLTDAMRSAGDSADDENSLGWARPEIMWPAMIDAALSEEVSG